MIRKATQGGSECGSTEWQEVSEVMWHDAMPWCSLPPLQCSQGVLTWQLGIRWKYDVGSIKLSLYFKRNQQINKLSHRVVEKRCRNTFIFQHPYLEGCKCSLGGALAWLWSGAQEPEVEQGRKLRRMRRAEIVTQSGPQPRPPHLCHISGPGKSISVADTPLCDRKAACCSIHTFTRLKMHQDPSNIPLVSSALMTQILIKVSGVICDTDPPVILSLMTDTGSWHSAVHHKFWPLGAPLGPALASIFRRNYTRTLDWNQPSVRYCCKLEFPVGARCDSPRPGTLGNLWLIS